VNDASIDKATLATLRPGMPASALRTLCGPIWDEVKPGEDGWVVKLADIGFTARIDVKDTIGKLAFSAKFPSTLSIDGLRIGMSFDDALALFPNLRHIQDVIVSMMTLRRFGAARSDGTMVELRFRDGRLLAFDLDRPDAVYGAAATT